MTPAPQVASPRPHARLAPSAAHRWMNCPGSVKLSEPFPNTSSHFAAEGTCAHTLASFCLENCETPYALLGQHVNSITGEITKTEPPEDAADDLWFEVTEDMAEAVSEYVEYFNTLCAAEGAVEFEIEQRLDMTHLHPDIFGTGDGVVWGRMANHLDVLDYKHGKGVVVSAEQNPQLMLYAAGAARRFHNRNVQTLTLHIVQPRATGPSIKTFDFDVLDLYAFEESVAEAARNTEKSNAMLSAGDWCVFCPAQAVCPEARRASLAVAAESFGDVGDLNFAAPEDLSPERLRLILDEADRIGGYVKAVQLYAHDQALRGVVLQGYKLVQKRAIRKWQDEETAKAYMLGQLGAKEDALYAEPKMRSPSQLEPLFPGKNKKERADAMLSLVVKVSSGVNLAPEKDPRPAVNVGASADFESDVVVD